MTRTYAVLVAALTVVAFIAAPALALQERGQAGQAGERGGQAVSRSSGGEGSRPAGGGGSGGPSGGGPSGGGSSGSGAGSGGGWGGSSSGAGSRMGSGGGGYGSAPSRERGGDYSRPNPGRQSGSSTGRTAVGRGEQTDGSRTGAVQRSGDIGVDGSRADRAGSFREVPQYSRPREGRPPVGNAQPRSEVRSPVGPGRPGYPGYSFYPYYPPGYWNNYWYWYPYGWGYPWYGSFGMGFFYYDPCWWGYPGGCYTGGGYGGYGGGYGYGQPGEAMGALRLKINPRTAQVYVDGYYAGIVDQFDGTFQRLKIVTGGHRIEVRQDGYEPLVFEVLIPPFETITYTGELKPKLP